MGDRRSIQLAHLRKISKERLGRPLERHPVIGFPQKLKPGVVPTYQEIAQAVLLKQSELRLLRNLKQNPPMSDVITSVTEDLLDLVNNLEPSETKEILRYDNLKTQVNKIIPVMHRIKSNKKLTRKGGKLFSEQVIVYKSSVSDNKSEAPNQLELPPTEPGQTVAPPVLLQAVSPPVPVQAESPHVLDRAESLSGTE